MGKTLSALLEEADGIISFKMNAGIQKEASSPQTDDVFAMAEWVRRPLETTKEAAVETFSDDVLYTLSEKIAHAKAILETYQNLPTILKIGEFEKNAKANGYNDGQIEEYLRENSASFQLKSVF